MTNTVQTMTIWRKQAGHWQEDTPDFRKLTGNTFKEMAGTKAALRWQDHTGTFYAYGDEFSKERLEAKYAAEPLILMDMESFAHYWAFKLLEFGIDIFCKVENLEERKAIMMTEGATEAEVIEYTQTRLDLYPEEWPEDF